MTMGPILLTIEDAARVLNVKVSRLRTAVFKREIGHIKLAGLIRFRHDDLEAWISKNQVKPRN